MDGSWWDDFSNNLATDLTPLIALLGEQPTKQYLSECLTIEDIAIFAIAPLGIITAVVSAIRVCGTPSLRAFVGRAQEGAGVAEAELCSSTSRDVCELYSNGGIARIFGRPKLLEVVHDPRAPLNEFFPPGGRKATAGIYTFPQYVTIKGKGAGEEWIEQQGFTGRRKGSSKLDEYDKSQQKPARFAPNPNLSLNIGIKPHGRLWFIAAAIFGTMIQSFVLVWAALTRYHYQWTRNSREDDYAVILTIIGTILLCLGMALCAHLIESKTKERVYQRATSNDPSRMYWVQPGNQSIGDQVFDSFAYSDVASPLQRYITSWKDTSTKPSTIGWVWTAVATTAIGFICQFLGLRACHSSVAVCQFGVTMIMALIRAGLRTQRLKKEDNLMTDFPAFFQGHELDYLALEFGNHMPQNAKSPSLSRFQSRRVWNVFNTLQKGDDTSTVTISHSHQSMRDKNNISILERMAEGDPSVLSGFRIKTWHSNNYSPGSTENIKAVAEKELSDWISTMYTAKHKTKYDCTIDNCKGCLNTAVKTVFYRGRLAHLTGLEVPESNHSSNWGDEFISVRDTARTLARAIEGTMYILFDSESQLPVTLYESWEKCFAIFWTVQCSLLDPLTQKSQDGGIYMSLRREIDHTGLPEGPWRVDRTELEAVLGLWLWSLKGPPKTEDVEEADSKPFTQRISHILSAYTSLENASSEMLDFNFWRDKGSTKIHQRKLNVGVSVALSEHGSESAVGESQHSNDHSFCWEGNINSAQVQNAVWWKDGEQFVTRKGGLPSESCDQQRFYGWHNVNVRSTCRELTVLEIVSNSTLLSNCAQEIYSTFLAAIMQAVKDIGAETKVREHQEGYTFINEKIDRIQDALTNSGLCDREDSFACVIPVLRNQNKLKLPSQIIPMVGGLVAFQHKKDWRQRYKELVHWPLDRKYTIASSQQKQQVSASTMEATNDFRLSLLEICETCRRALLGNDNEQNMFGCKEILALLRHYSQDEMIMSIPLVWVDCGTVPHRPNQKCFSLADAILCYGEAALWRLHDKQSPSTQERRLKAELEGYFNPRQIGGSLFTAVWRSDLSTTLYLLERDFLHEPQLTRTLMCALQKGWYMVVKTLIKLGAQTNEKDDNGRTSLSHAAELGDINTARLLINEAVVDASFKSKHQGTTHYAAKQGHAVITNDLVDKWGTDNEDHEGMTPMNWAITSGNVAVLSPFIRVGRNHDFNNYRVKKPALHWAIKEGKEDMVDALLKNDFVDPNLKNTKTVNAPPLTCAVILRSESIFKKILGAKKVDADCIDKRRRTALWWAAVLGLDSYVQKLLESGKVCRPDRVDYHGVTALSAAVLAGHLKVVHQLQGWQSSTVKLRDALLAARSGKPSILEELLPSRVRSKGDAKRLLEAYGLEGIWQNIQDSNFQAEMSEDNRDIDDIIKDTGSLGDIDMHFEEIRSLSTSESLTSYMWSFK